MKLARLSTIIFLGLATSVTSVAASSQPPGFTPGNAIRIFLLEAPIVREKL